MNFERPQLQALIQAFHRPSPVMHVLTGPRQVGKTTMARQLAGYVGYPAVYSTADGPEILDGTWLRTQWRRASVAAKDSASPVLLILDEVQKVRGWSETMKRLWDDRDPSFDIRVLLLGSSALLMQEGLTESLAGRFFLHRCGHWGLAECRQAFDWSLEQWLYFGGYPGAAHFASDQGQWRSYVVDSLIETVLSRDVLQMSRVGKPALLRNLFSLAASLPGRIMSYTKMLGRLQDAGNTTTLAHYLRLLEAAFLLSGLEAFSLGKKRLRGSSPKLVLWNNALVNAMSGLDFDQTAADSQWWGRLVENAVGAWLCQGMASLEFDVTYWREKNWEVDFVVTRGSRICAIEVKSGVRGKASGLKRFKAHYPQAQTLMVGGPGIPLEEFLTVDPIRWLE